MDTVWMIRVVDPEPLEVIYPSSFRVFVEKDAGQ
jgi:hypothetical protein